MSQLADLLRETQSLHVTEKALKCGDVMVADICIERKTVKDFQVSVVDGRLFRQLTTMRRTHARCLLIVEDDVEGFADRIHIASAQGALLKVTAGWQVPYVFSRDTCETADIVARIAYQEARADAGALVSRPGYKPKRLSTQMRYALEAIPKIGATRSNALLSHFGSVRAVAIADVSELVQVEGITATIAQSIKSFFRRSYLR